MGAPIWDISDDDEDSPLIQSLFHLLRVTPPEASLLELYLSFTDYSTGYRNRINRGDFLFFLSDDEDKSFLGFDMFADPTDSMDVVSIIVCAPYAHGDEIKEVLESIRDSAEVFTALLDGNLGVQEDCAIKNFPRIMSHDDPIVVQHAQVFRGGKLIHQTTAP